MKKEDFRIHQWPNQRKAEARRLKAAKLASRLNEQGTKDADQNPTTK